MDQVYLRFDESIKPDEMRHFGVKGMHWGVWNAETRARYLGGNGRRVRGSDIRGSRGRGGASSSRNAGSGGNGWDGLSDRQKTALKVAGGVAAVAAVAGLAVVASKTGAGKKATEAVLAQMKNVKMKDVPKPAPITNPDKMLPKPVHEFERSLPKTPPGQKFEDHLKSVNPGFGSSCWGSVDNCTSCSTALEMRLRGFDVEAVSMSEGRHAFVVANDFKDVKVHGLYDGLSEKQLKEFSNIMTGATTFDERLEKSAKFMLKHPSVMLKLSKNSQNESARALEYFSKMPEGARGNFIGVSKEGGGGHSMFWQIENGKVRIHDGQGGESYKDAVEIINKYQQLQYFRTDNKQINWEQMSKVVKPHNPYYDSMPSNMSNRFSVNTGYADKTLEDLLWARDFRK